MKRTGRLVVLLLTLVLAMSVLPSALAADAVLSPQKLTVDGVGVDCEKYNIDGSNYFKLRDLAYVLNGTSSQFGVGYDEATSTVSITTGADYTPVGTELVTGVDNSSTAQSSGQAILIDGVRHGDLTVYNIGGNNFFQLRELGDALGFDVDYDTATNTAIVRSREAVLTEELLAMAYDMPEASYERLPDWYGLEYEPMGDWPDGYKNYGFSSEKFQEQDIRNVSELGFNFLRVPVNTRFFFEDADTDKPCEEYWSNLDELIAWGIQYKVHISLVVCETYGYNCTYTEAEGELFTNDSYMELFLTFWEKIAQRYQNVPNNALSFNILNEPTDWIGEERYCKLALNTAERIRNYSPDRLIISDMFAWGTQPLYGLVDSRIVQAIHWYEPRELTNGAPGVSWPNTSYDIDWLRDSLKLYDDFAAETGTTVFLNEFGSSVKVDYDAVLPYIDDILIVIDEYGWSWSMYDYIGGFGLVKGNNPEHIRKGAVYETIGGCQVDTGLYAVLKKHFN